MTPDELLDAQTKKVIRGLEHLIGACYMWRAGTRTPTPEEERLIEDIAEWYVTRGKRLAEERRGDVSGARALTRLLDTPMHEGWSQS